MSSHAAPAPSPRPGAFPCAAACFDLLELDGINHTMAPLDYRGWINVKTVAWRAANQERYKLFEETP
jgi:hypothetical protein